MKAGKTVGLFGLPVREKPLTKDESLLTIQQAADLLGVHYQTVRYWIHHQQIDFRRWGRKTIRIPREAIDGKARQP